MNLAAEPCQGSHGFVQAAPSILSDRALAAPRNGTAIAGPDGLASNLHRAWLLSAQARARPGFMTLRAVRDGGQVVNFVWDFASASAGRLLCRAPSSMLGRPLLAVLGEVLGPASVLGHYRRVVESTEAEADEHFHVIDGVEDLFRHRAVRLGDGVAVTLTNLSAVGRAHGLRQNMLRSGLALW